MSVFSVTAVALERGISKGIFSFERRD